MKSAEEVVKAYWKLRLGQEDLATWLEHEITAYADEKLEEAAQIADRNDRSPWGIASEIRHRLKSTPAPGGASK